MSSKHDIVTKFKKNESVFGYEIKNKVFHVGRF